MVMVNPPDAGHRSADRAQLHALLLRSSATIADLLAQVCSSDEKGLVIGDRLREGMVRGEARSVGWQNVVTSESAALLRWEDEGGSPDVDEWVVKPASGDA